MTNDARHTAISCQHPTSVIRDRMHAVLHDMLVNLVVSSLLDRDSDTLVSDIEVIVSRVTAECSAIMHEHADEMANEYKAILASQNERRTI